MRGNRPILEVGTGEGRRVERPALSKAEDCFWLPQRSGISELTEAHDWWSFGSLLYELLTGTVSSVGQGVEPLAGVIRA